MELYTVGYEGTDIEDFVKFLARNGIKRIIDVRKNPVSRKKGFSKHKLADALRTKNIDYVHLPALGMPREWRQQAKDKEITRAQMFKKFDARVLPAQQKEIEEVQKLMKEKPSALLCFEADPHDCHRHNVANEVLRHEKRKLKVIDLHVQQPAEEGPSLFR